MLAMLCDMVCVILILVALRIQDTAYTMPKNIALVMSRFMSGLVFITTLLRTHFIWWMCTNIHIGTVQQVVQPMHCLIQHITTFVVLLIS
jgi:p-aminobenzoyl-glutamate transporter AbgT